MPTPDEHPPGSRQPAASDHATPFRNWSVMNLNLTAKTAVVTGTSRDIGLATVQTLIDEGVRAMGPARRSSRPSRQAPRRRCTGAHHQQALELADAIDSARGEAHRLAGPEPLRRGRRPHRPNG